MRKSSPPQASQPPRQEPPPGYMQLACVTATHLLPPARMQQIATLPSHRAGSSRLGCWNCGCFGHSWVDCHQPRMRFCRMYGRHGCTIATCASCCDECGRRRLQELEEERLQLEELPPFVFFVYKGLYGERCSFGCQGIINVQPQIAVRVFKVIFLLPVLSYIASLKLEFAINSLSLNYRITN